MTKKTTVGICNGRSCCRTNAKLWKLAEDLPEDQFKVEEAACLDRCRNAPSIRIDDPETGQRVKHANVDEATMLNLLNQPTQQDPI